MKKPFFILALVLVASFSASAQPADKKAVDIKLVVDPAADAAALVMAKAAQVAHGGDKFKAVRSMVSKGSVDMNVMGQAVPGAFSIAYSGEKYFFDLVTPAQQLKQVFDGNSTYTSLQGFYMPPAASVGFPVLSHVGDKGYVVSAIPDPKKRSKGFRVLTPDGYYTDFFIDEKTKVVKSYESSYDMGQGRIVTTSVSLDEFETIDGVLAPKKFSQRFDLGTITAYVTFKAKTILINSKIEDSAFTLPGN
jgi:hypothetical protein